MAAIEELYEQWTENTGDLALTLALCDVLRGSGRIAVIQTVGETVQREHPQSAPALIAAGRMYNDAMLLAEAQAALLLAGKVAPREATVYRWLGEVLLRRGDADRAEKVLGRAIELGATDGDTSLWMERARVFRPMQGASGARAVASEIAKSAGVQSRTPPPMYLQPPPEQPYESEDPTTEHKAARSDSDEMRLAAAVAFTKERDPHEELLGPHAPRNGDMRISDDETTLAQSSPLQQQIAIDMTAPPPKPTPPPKLPGGRVAPPGFGAASGLGAQATTGGAQAQTSGHLAASAVAFAPTSPAAGAPPGRPISSRPPLIPGAAPPPLFNAPPPPMPLALEPVEAPAKKRAPDPRDVLDALQLAGIYEPDNASTGATGWVRAEKGPPRWRSPVVLGVATALLLGSGFGVFRYVNDLRAKQHEMSEQLLAKVEQDIHAAKPSTLAATEQDIGKAFELDSRSPRAALAWAHERALVGLVRGGSDVAFEDAIGRAREVKVPEEQLAFAPVASFIFQNDTVGAAGLLPKWDGPAANDAWYQLLAGTTLERAGAPRAPERFSAAVKLDPQLLIAEVMLARAFAIDGDAVKAADLARAFRQKYPDRAEGVALVAFAWGRDPSRGNDEPREVADTIAHAAELPATLAFVPHAMLALRAIDKRAPDEAKGHIERGLAVADTPGVASWLGTIALDTGDEQLARKAALSAVSFSAVYPPARVLAARVALLGDRLDEALKATEELEPGSPDVAVVRAAVAYERVDADSLGRALDAVPADAKKLPFLAPLSYSPDVMLGRLALAPDKLVAAANEEAPWSDLLAMDMALDGGDLDSAQKIAQNWKGTERRPLHALRLSRLARYSGHPDEADPLSEIALREGTPTVRSLSERVFVLVARGKHHDVGPLLAKYPLVLGPLATWLSAYATASSGKVEDARGKLAQLDPAPATSSLPARVITAMALAATRDKRRGPDYVKGVLTSAPSHPDLGAAAVQLGGKRQERTGKPATFSAP